MATSDEEENIYEKPGAIRRGGGSNTAVGFYSRGVQPTEVQISDDYSPPSDDPVTPPGEGGGEGGDGNEGGFTPEPDPFSDNAQYIDVNPAVSTLARIASFAPGPVGLAAGIGKAAVGLNNLDWTNNQRAALGLEQIGGWETVKAATGFSDYANGKVGTVDIGGRQREVTYGGGLVGEGPDVEKRTAMTPDEAARRLASVAKSYNPVNREVGGNSDNRPDFSGGVKSDPSDYNSGFGGFTADRAVDRATGGLYGGGNDSGGNNNNGGGGNFGGETPGGAGSGPSRGDASQSGGSRGGGSEGGGSSRVICTELYRQGKISRADWKRDLAYTSTHLSDRHVRGYHAWAIPTVRLMRRSQLWTAVWRVLGQARANQIAYIMDDRAEPDAFGAVAKVVLESFCWVVGGFVGDRDAVAELSETKEIN